MPAEAADVAEETLGGASAVAEHLPDELAEPLLRVAQSAFAHGFAMTAMVGAPLLAVTAVVAAVLLRRVRVGQ